MPRVTLEAVRRLKEQARKGTSLGGVKLPATLAGPRAH